MPIKIASGCISQHKLIGTQEHRERGILVTHQYYHFKNRLFNRSVQSTLEIVLQ